MNHVPCCPIHQSTLYSPDYWIDPALMSFAATASSVEWPRWEIQSRSRHAKCATRHGQMTDDTQSFLSWVDKALLILISIFFIENVANFSWL